MSNPTLADLCTLIADSEHKTAPKDSDGQHPLVRTTDLGNARVDFARAQRVNADTYAKWTRRGEPQTGDLILAREAPVGGVARVPEGVQPVLGQRTVLLRPGKTVDSRFLMYRLAAVDLQARMNEMATGSTVAHLNMSDIRTFEIPNLPALSEQKRRAAVLGVFDELIAINKRRIELLEDLARSLYREWFVRFRFPGHCDVTLHDSMNGSRVPSGWNVALLRDVATLRYGKALPARSRRSGTVPVISSAGVIDQHDEALVEAPGIVLGRKGNVGSVWWIDRPFFPIDTTYFVESDLPLGLLYWQLRDMAFIDSHAAVPGLSREQAYGLPVIVPPNVLVRTFDSAHQACFGSMSGLRSTNAALAHTRDLLLPRLVTGRVDIADVDLAALLPEEIAA